MQYPNMPITWLEDTICSDLQETITGYEQRSRGAYRRWYNNRQRQLVEAAEVGEHLPPPIEFNLSDSSSYEDEYDTSDEEEYEREFYGADSFTAVQGPTPGSAQETSTGSAQESTPGSTTGRKRTFSDCLSTEDSEPVMDKPQEEYKHRKEEKVKDDTTFPDCPICLETIDKALGISAAVASCGHIFCTQCYMRTCSTLLPRPLSKSHKCPMCRSRWNKPYKVHMMPQGATIADCKLKMKD